MMNKRTPAFLLAATLFISVACNNSTSKKHTDTSTKGNITISVDESLKPIMEAEKDVFEALYPEAKLNLVYTNEYDAIEMLAKDSARIAIVTREMLPTEKTNFDARKIVPRYVVIGYDAIGIIMNNSRTDTILSQQQLADIMTGKVTTWKALNPKNSNSPIRVVFDNAKSGAVRHIKDSLLKGADIGKNCYAVKSNPDVIDQVEKDKNTIGIIGVSWISDRDDSTTNSFFQRVNVVELIPTNPEKAEAPTMKPYQAYIALKQYPLYRNITIINPEGRYGLGTGFASFINSDKGQRIILKSGLVPAHAPVRIIRLNND